MIDELYIVGNQSRLVEKNIINQFLQTGIKTNVFSPDNRSIDRLPITPIQLIVLVSDDIDFEIIKKIAHYQKKHNYHLCFIGRMDNLVYEDDKFYRQIPSIKVKSNTINIGELLELMEKNENSRKHILVVDDEPIILRSIKTWLSDDFELSLVNSGETALEFLDMHPVDLVLLDYKMPTMDGPQVLDKIRCDERLRKLPRRCCNYRKYRTDNNRL